MKKLLRIPILLASAATYVLAADAPSLTGKWAIHINVMGNEAEQSCTFTQSDKALTGSCTGERVDGSISGTVDGNKVKWQLKRPSEGPLDFSGTIAADGKITGTLEVSEHAVSGEFTATKAK